jgi:glycosyltransferase involved in cell wall biosynthesis
MNRTSKPKILFLTQYGSMYGAGTSLYNLVQGLSERGYKCIVVNANRGEINKKLDEEGIENYIEPFLPWVYKTQKKESILKKVKNKLKLKTELILKNRPVINRITSFIVEKEIDIIYSNMVIFNVGQIVAKRTKKLHIWHVRSFVDIDFNLKWINGKHKTVNALKKANTVIFNSQAVRQHFYNKKILNSAVVPNSVISQNQYNSELNRVLRQNTADFTFAIIGSINSAKGQKDAIAAVAKLNKTTICKLLIIGKGETDALKQLSQKLNIADKVEFLGHVDRVFDVYHKFDAVLVCSKNEAFGRVTVEAMYGQKPVIGRNSGGTKEIIRHKENGLLYDGTINDLSHKMHEIMLSPSLRNKLVQIAFKEVGEKYLHEHYVNAIQSLIVNS